jgi:hypothetical protein
LTEKKEKKREFVGERRGDHSCPYNYRSRVFFQKLSIRPRRLEPWREKEENIKECEV